MNNFASASAIVTALMSPKVAMIVLACDSRAAQIIHKLNRDLAPESGAYYDTLRQAGTKELTPWLGAVGPLRISYYHLTLSQTPSCPPSTQHLPTQIPLLRWTDIIWSTSSYAANWQSKSIPPPSTRRRPSARKSDRTYWNTSSTTFSRASPPTLPLLQRPAAPDLPRRSGRVCTRNGKRRGRLENCGRRHIRAGWTRRGGVTLGGGVAVRHDCVKKIRQRRGVKERRSGGTKTCHGGAKKWRDGVRKTRHGGVKIWDGGAKTWRGGVERRRDGGKAMRAEVRTRKTWSKYMERTRRDGDGEDS